MRCELESYDEQCHAVRVITETGRRVTIVALPDEKFDYTFFFPLRPGYASTILRFQGSELKFVIAWLDAPYVRAAAYTAMSRVKYQRHCLVGGMLTPEHFTPAQ